MYTNVLTWIRADWTHALVALGAVLFAIATVWGAIKAAYLKTVGHPMPRTRLTLTLDVIAELAVNALGAINKILSARGGASLWATLPADSGAPLVGRPTQAPPPPSGQGGYIAGGPLLLLALVATLVLGAAIFGCLSWQRPACPTPGSYRCAGDLPEYCAPSRQWTTGGDEPCSRQGRTCALASNGEAWCAPMDGGVR